MPKKVNANVNDEKEVHQVQEFLEYKFNEQELKEISSELARATSEQNNLENEKKAVMSEFKAKIDTKAAERQKLAGHINTGCEYRYIDCEMMMNTPKVGRKTLTRLDTAEVVWEKEMSKEELQLRLNLETDDAEVEHSIADDNNK